MSEERGAGKVLLALAMVAAAAVGLGGAWWLAQPDQTVGQFDRLAAVIGCQCGTCPLRPIATCGCGFADGMLSELQELVDEGLPDDEVMSTFVVRYNESIRIKPSASGLDLTAWAAPIVLLTVGAVGVGGVLASWVRTSRAAAAEVAMPASEQPSSSPAPTESDRARAIVERELSNLED